MGSEIDPLPHVLGQAGSKGGDKLGGRMDGAP